MRWMQNGEEFTLILRHVSWATFPQHVILSSNGSKCPYGNVSHVSCAVRSKFTTEFALEAPCIETWESRRMNSQQREGWLNVEERHSLSDTIINGSKQPDALSSYSVKCQKRYRRAGSDFTNRIYRKRFYWSDFHENWTNRENSEMDCRNCLVIESLARENQEYVACITNIDV